MEPTVVDAATSLKEARLAAWLRERRTVLIGYSGGVDSTYLAVLAREVLGRDHVFAVLGRSASVPAAQSESARSIAMERDIALRVVETSELSDERYAANPVNRCYFCKSTLWQTLVPLARELGVETILDGTNADDVSEYRPGARAGSEHGIHSPLALVGARRSHCGCWSVVAVVFRDRRGSAGCENVSSWWSGRSASRTCSRAPGPRSRSTRLGRPPGTSTSTSPAGREAGFRRSPRRRLVTH